MEIIGSSCMVYRYNAFDAGRISADFCDHLLGIDLKPQWNQALNCLSEHFPGSFSSLLIQRFDINACTAIISGEIDEQSIENYSNYYSYINPWIYFWKNVNSSDVLISEEKAPSILYNKTEFYNDWLKPLGNGEASVGFKLKSNNNQIIHFPIHFSLNYANYYQYEIAQVLNRVKSFIQMAANMEQIASDSFQDGGIEALKSKSNGAVFIVDHRSCLLDCNHISYEYLEKGLLSVQASKLYFHVVDINEWFYSALSSISKSLVGAKWSRSFVMGDCFVGLEIFPIPTREIFGFQPTVSKFAVCVNDHSDTASTIDFDTFASSYRLTPSETLLCKYLAEGNSLSEIAKLVNVTEETVRKRLKSVFSKTDIHRQGELVARLFKVRRIG